MSASLEKRYLKINEVVMIIVKMMDCVMVIVNPIFGLANSARTIGIEIVTIVVIVKPETMLRILRLLSQREYFVS